MSEDAAYKRIQVARAARLHPEMLELLAAGRIHLSGLALLAPHLGAENAERLLAQAAGLSKLRIEVLVRTMAPKPDVRTSVRRVARAKPSQAAVELAPGQVALPSPRKPAPAIGSPQPMAPLRNARVTPLSPARFHVNFTASERFKGHIDAALELAAPSTTLEALIEDALELWIKMRQKERLGVPGRKAKASANTGGRYIAKAIRRTVWQRDGGQCTYCCEASRRCSEKRGLQFDHVVPHARGGQSTADNLRLRCSAHNQLWAEECFGPLFVAAKRAKASALGE